MRNNEEKIISTVGVLIFKDGKVLLVRHGEKAEHLSGVYGLPAGRVGDNENEIDTAIRELYEETGLRVSSKNLQELPNIYTARIQRKNEIKTFSLKVFLARFYSGNLKTIKKTDETIPEWVKISDLDKYSLLPNVQRVIKDGLEIIDNPAGHH